jgi:hypothetical protein
MSSLRSCTLAVGLLLIAASGAASQEIRGVLRHERTQLPIAGGLVRLLMPSGAVVDTARTDSAGEFRLHAARAGAYILTAEADDYAPSRSQVVQVGTNQIVTVQMLLDTVVLLDPLLVTARDEFDGWLGEFRLRRRLYEPLGGRYFTREDFDWIAAVSPSEVVATLMPMFFFSFEAYPGRRNIPVNRPRLAVVRHGQHCEPIYMLNHHRIVIGRNDPDARIEDFVNLNDVTAIEVYRPGATPPAGVSASCGGAIVFWTLPGRAGR